MEAFHESDQIRQLEGCVFKSLSLLGSSKSVLEQHIKPIIANVWDWHRQGRSAVLYLSVHANQTAKWRNYDGAWLEVPYFGLLFRYQMFRSFALEVWKSSLSVFASLEQNKLVINLFSTWFIYRNVERPRSETEGDKVSPFYPIVKYGGFATTMILFLKRTPVIHLSVSHSRPTESVFYNAQQQCPSCT